MARGWGKSFEDQVEEGNQRASDSDPASSVPLQTRIRLQRIESLKLSRSRVLSQLERATLPAHREVLLKGLQAIEKEIAENPTE